ncbi:nucleotidyltransferase family protein [Gracilimonas mengyeensis]|uniref:Polymerase beta nucleotidyltransferase domain-containing protein n=1 Tax=Gracilimonas mengyeensis TaxID=1302730 RepID=A0A521F488_9BACT|nr:nucleotidyltransferase domain-containing protein [Gracilimonas mengyeensis]SMO90846.1 hypothetical protein SAMN06265219_11512 [Gracilimonas mengyeensis]
MDAILKNKIRGFFKDKPVLKAYLFGSHANGTSAQNSDIDILVELDHSQPIGLKFVRMQLELEELLNSKVDLVTARSLSKYILPEVERKKELIYER